MAENNKSQNTPATASKDVAVDKKDVNTDVENTRRVNENLETEYGTTTIENTVVSKIAGIAAREVSGVAALGGGGARLVGNIRESLGASEDVRQGVSVDVNEGVANISVAIIAEYGVAIHELAEAIRRNIMNSVERMTGLDVSSVDVTVHDVKLPSEDEDESDNEQPALIQN
ncbi:alkaline-shock protein [Corynebacterium phocae]|uniref:Alkaline-shock protein n=1 Tax=Corynebacterium phocae TaxID=161895 RepID=A0A1L7D5B1_9CORY|nr:Asp23/Gls24 family envelope stress response protein [Corynebacterium phocae]APT93257.1 alkaline-shock protein [Corynebacterium phocae]KAA8721577.1 Asp23/Gls24 family envelope stress response protein [Corynebacterium phocae]